MRKRRSKRDTEGGMGAEKDTKTETGKSVLHMTEVKLWTLSKNEKAVEI